MRVFVWFCKVNRDAFVDIYMCLGGFMKYNVTCLSLYACACVDHSSFAIKGNTFDAICVYLGGCAR